MADSRFRLVLRIPLQWLICLALVLPVAQVAAIAHTLSHVGHASGSSSGSASVSGVVSDAGDDASADSAGPAAHKVHCDLCVAAAAVSGGAPIVEAARWWQDEAVHVVRVVVSAPAREVASPRPYQSRAPPLASR
jgi:hypothetical protein